MKKNTANIRVITTGGSIGCGRKIRCFKHIMFASKLQMTTRAGKIINKISTPIHGCPVDSNLFRLDISTIFGVRKTFDRATGIWGSYHFWLRIGS